MMRALYPDLPAEDLQAPKPTAFGRVVERLRLGRGIKIQGVDGLMVRYAQCCQPVPGDLVVGYVTQGRGISIHRSDCPNLLLLSTEAERRIEIDWQESEGETFVVRLAVGGEDRRGLYADICTAISESGTNIRSAEISTRDGAVFGSVLVEVENQTHLNKVIRAIRRVKGGMDVSRRESGPQTDTYIAKDSSINDDIDRLRLRATSSLMEREDVVIVASVSAIYGLGDPEAYRERLVTASVGEERGRDALLEALVGVQYQRNDTAFERGTV